ncbi:MAG: hypothetical protein WBQ44_06160, partial [Rhodococcus sp. (in: high G+C Gram-positive bacteria)]
MSIDTHIDGEPESVRQVARWLRDSLAPVLEESANKVFAARNRIDGAWDGPASQVAIPKLSAGAEGALRMSAAARDNAQQIDDFAAGLQKALNLMADARRDASAAGLFVVGDVIEGAASGNQAAAYGIALDTADTARTVERQAAEALAGIWTNPYVDWFFYATDLLDASAASVVDVQVSALSEKAQWLRSESNKFMGLARNAPEGTPASVVYRDVDYARTTAARAVDLTETAKELGSKAERVGLRVGGGLAVAGVAWDIYNGKPTDQAIVSGGASFAASVAAGAAIGT